MNFSVIEFKLGFTSNRKNEANNNNLPKKMHGLKIQRVQVQQNKKQYFACKNETINWKFSPITAYRMHTLYFKNCIEILIISTVIINFARFLLKK